MTATNNGKVDWFDMPEEDYRSSRIFRALGSPKAFSVIKLLLENEHLSVEEITSRLKRSKWNTSKILRPLRDLDIVRYQKDGRWTLYTLKDRAGMRSIVAAAAGYMKNNHQDA